MKEIAEIKKSLLGGENPKNIKMRLAREIVAMYHDAKAAEKAEEIWQSTFKEGIIPESTKVVTIKIQMPLSDILMKEGIVKSKSEFHRLVKEGAITFQGTVEERKIIDPQSLISEDGALRIGKKRFLKIRITKK